MPDEAIVLVGGLGTRLRGVVSDVPKPLAQIAGRPFLAWLLDHLARSGLRRVLLSVGYRADMIRDAIGDRHAGVTVDYVEEQTPLGTGGALRQALRSVDGTSAFALNGDTLFLVSLAEMARTAASFPDRLIVALRAVDEADRYGTCLVEHGRIVAFTAARPQGAALINGGVYVLPRGIFDPFDLPERFSFEADFMESNVATLQPRAVIDNANFIDIGVPATFEAAQTLVPSWLSR